jgi:hypothetical protein
MMKKLFLLAAFALSACATTPTATVGNRMDWRCSGGAAFSARIGADGRAEVFAGGQVYRLPHVEGGGARYSDGRVEYQERAGEATLNGAQGGPYTSCRRP